MSAETNCPHHEAVDVRLTHLEAHYREIKGLCFAILAGCIISVTMNYMQIKQSRNGDGEARAETQIEYVMPEEVIRAD